MTIVFVGWVGTLLYLVNHVYISINSNWRKSIYYGGNTLAAICLIVSSYTSNSWQAVFINTFWVLISMSLLLGMNLNTIKFNKRFFYGVVVVMLSAFVWQLIFLQHFSPALLGWISAFVFSACYLLFSAERMLPRYYLCWNAFAAIVLLPQLWLDNNWPVFGLEIVWAVISIYGAVRRFEQVHLIQ